MILSSFELLKKLDIQNKKTRKLHNKSAQMYKAYDRAVINEQWGLAEIIAEQHGELQDKIVAIHAEA